jgi:hypothetical protein
VPLVVEVADAWLDLSELVRRVRDLVLAQRILVVCPNIQYKEREREEIQRKKRVLQKQLLGHNVQPQQVAAAHR